MASATPFPGIVKALPISTMFAAPLNAAIEGHTMACQSFANFIDEVGFLPGATDSQSSDPTKSSVGQTRMVRFQYNQNSTDETGAVTGSEMMSIDVPFLAIIPLPAFGVDTLNVDFDLTVNTATSDTSSTGAQGSVTASGGWGPVKVSVTGSVSHKSEQTRSTDTSARYTVKLAASRQPPTEAMMRIIDAITTAATKPVKASEAPALAAGSTSGGGGGTPP